MILQRTNHNPQDIPDEALMLRIAEGDKTAYKMLVDRHLRGFLAFATRVLSDRYEAEDVMQEAFIRVWKAAQKWDQSRNARFTTWFYRIVMNLCIDAKRKRKPTSDLAAAYDVKSDAALPDADLSDQQMAVQVAEGLQQLPGRQNVAMTLCYLQGLGNKEAAEILGISVGAVESLLVRGRSRLAEVLKEHKDEFLKERA